MRVCGSEAQHLPANLRDSLSDGSADIAVRTSVVQRSGVFRDQLHLVSTTADNNNNNNNNNNSVLPVVIYPQNYNYALADYLLYADGRCLTRYVKKDTDRLCNLFQLSAFLDEEVLFNLAIKQLRCRYFYHEGRVKQLHPDILWRIYMQLLYCLSLSITTINNSSSSSFLESWLRYNLNKGITVERSCYVSKMMLTNRDEHSCHKNKSSSDFKLLRFFTHRDDRKHGVEKLWYVTTDELDTDYYNISHRQLFLEAYYDVGYLNGLWSSWSEAGELVKTNIYNHGYLRLSTCYSGGEIVSVVKFSKSASIVEELSYSRGQLLSSITIYGYGKNTTINYGDKGQIVSTTEVVHGKCIQPVVVVVVVKAITN